MAGKIRVAVIGYGNIGRAAVQAVEAARDMELAGVVERQAVLESLILPDLGAPAAERLGELIGVQVALLCVPSRSVPEVAVEVLRQGVSTVDCFDIHGKDLRDLKERLDVVAREVGRVAVTAAGWDPGADSLIRAIFLAMAPRGLTYTNYGPGMSMGHTVAAKAIPGVREAVSLTIPLGTGFHRRIVYVVLEPGADLGRVTELMRQDPYFARDELRVIQVEDVRDIIDVGHGVSIERKGASGLTGNQLLKFEARVNNPALTAQVMTCAARAALRQSPGCYTLLEIPVGQLLAGPLTDDLIGTVV